MRRVLLLPFLALVACGGSGESTAPPPPNPLYVATTGNDANAGDAGAPLRSIRRAAQLALDDYEIIVAPGTYAEEVNTDRTGTPAQRLTFTADADGSRTGSAPGAVRIQAQGAGFSLGNSAGSLIEGFTITGATAAAVEIKDASNGAIVRDCVIVGNPGHGVRVQDSAGVVVFNNLIADNGRTGVILGGQSFGAPDAVVVSNTIARNAAGRTSERGLTVGTTQSSSAGAFVRNNIIVDNGPGEGQQVRVIEDPRNELGFDGDFNLVRPPTYAPSGARGPNDIDDPPEFVDAGAGDYRLSPSSPALGAGDPELPAPLRAHLRVRTTTGGLRDVDGLDLGVHFPLS